MAAPAYRAASWLSAAVLNVTTVTPTLPSGWQAGDLARIVIYQSNGNATQPAAPTGWTAAARADRSLTGGNLQSYWRIMQAGDTAPVFSWTTASAVRWQSAAFTGFDKAAPINVANGSNNAASTTITCPGVTPTVPESLLVWDAGDTSTPAITKPASMTLIGSATASVGSAMAYEVYAGTAATGNRNGTLASAVANVAELTALAPPPGPPRQIAQPREALSRAANW